MMTKAKFSGLDLTIKLNPFQQFYDEGFSQDFISKYADLVEKYHRPRPFLSAEVHPMEQEQTKKGFFFCFFKDFFLFKIQKVHISYKNINELYSLFIRAHEETHALEEFGKLKRLEEEIKKNFKLQWANGKEITFELLHHESIADIGGMYALLKRGYTKEEIERDLPINFAKYHQLFKPRLD